MGRRYIEVFSAKKQDYYAACQAALALSRGEVVGAGSAGANAGDDAQAGGVRAGGGGGGGGAGGAAGSGQGGHGGGRGNGSQRVEAEHTGVLKVGGARANAHALARSLARSLFRRPCWSASVRPDRPLDLSRASTRTTTPCAPPR